MTEEIKPEKLSEIELWKRHIQFMNEIVSEMKEIPILESEKPKDVASLLKVEFPEKGGILTYMEGHDGFPFKGFPYYEFVDKIDFIKKIVRAFLSGLYHQLKSTHKLWFLTLIPGLWLSKVLVRSSIYVFYRTIERFRIKNIRYSDAVRELYGAFSYQNPEEKIKDQEFRFQIRDLACSILEFDNAYRYRFQDIMEDLDKELLKSDPVKELLRLSDIMIGREKTQEIRDTWKLAKYFIRFYLRFDRKLTKIIAKTLENLDLSKVIMDEIDKHYCEKRKDYNFKHYNKQI